MKLKIVLASLILFTGFLSRAQLKVQSNGTVTIGATAAGSYTLNVAGYAALRLYDGANYVRFSPATSNVVIGTGSDRVAFWESATSYHDLNASAFVVSSDSMFKTNIRPIENGLDKVMELKPRSYYLKEDVEAGEATTTYGFVAQEVQQVLPEIVDSGIGCLLMNYDQIIPLLVESVQIQQNIIDSLNTRIEDLESSIYDGGIKNKSAVNTTPEGEFIELGQNNPNPFKESTTIPYTVPETTQRAQIIVYDMRGEQLKAYELTQFGNGQLIIEGNTFKAGMYMYALIVDGNYIDTKRMILSK